MNITETKNLNRVALFAIDAGNRHIKWVDYKGNSFIVPSYTYEVPDYQDTLIPDAKSVVLEIDGKRLVVGQIAKEFGGKPSFQGNKAELANLLILAAIAPIHPSDSMVTIETLRLALPDSRNQENLDHLKALEGVQTITRNGHSFTYSIRKVEAMDECVGAYRFAAKAGLLKYLNSGKPNGILDCGGGTTLGRIFDGSGRMMRQADIKLPGTFNLAREIAISLSPRTEYTPDLDLIMDGIADGSFLYAMTGINFKKEFLEAHGRWLEDIRSRLKVAWHSQLSQLAEVLIVGGSASLLKPMEIKTNGRFKVVPNPQFIGVKGMLLEV